MVISVSCNGKIYAAVFELARKAFEEHCHATLFDNQIDFEILTDTEKPEVITSEFFNYCNALLKQ